VTCRSGCRTQDHATWGECARDSGLQVGDLEGVAARTDRRLNAYATARGLGLQPPSTKIEDSQRTLREAGA
jgi:hypothetical protein